MLKNFTHYAFEHSSKSHPLCLIATMIILLFYGFNLADCCISLNLHFGMHVTNCSIRMHHYARNYTGITYYKEV